MIDPQRKDALPLQNGAKKFRFSKNLQHSCRFSVEEKK